MKLYEAIAKINKADIDSCYEIEMFTEALDISYYGYSDTIKERLKVVFLTKWMCTDSWVGTRVYFLDDIPVAISYQNARKSSECVDFLSENDVERMRQFIFALLAEDDSVGKNRVCNLDKEIGEYYNICYSDQLLTKKGFYKGQAVEVVKTYGYNTPHTLWQFVDVSLNGETITIPMSEFDIPFNVVE